MKNIMICCLHVALFAGLGAAALASFSLCVSQFRSHVQEILTEDKANIVRKHLNLMNACYHAVITPVGWILISIVTHRNRCEVYLQQCANYANEAHVQWGLKRPFVLPLVSGEVGG